MANDPTSRRGVKALVRQNGRVLLIRERRADGSTFWTLPGGGLAPGEPPEAGLRREVEEELGCRVAVGDPVDRRRYRHRSRPDTVTVYTVYAASLLEAPTPNRRERIVDLRWTTPETLPAATLDPMRAVVEAVTSDRPRSTETAAEAHVGASGSSVLYTD